MNDQTPHGKPGFLTPGDCTKLTHIAATREFWSLSVVLLQLFAGMRFVEAYGCRWEDLNLDAGVWVITNTKSAKTKAVSIAKNLDAWLRPLECFNGRVYDGSQSSLQSQITNVFRLAELPRTPGVLRHTFALYSPLTSENEHRTGGTGAPRESAGQRPSKRDVKAFWNILPPDLD